MYLECTIPKALYWYTILTIYKSTTILHTHHIHYYNHLIYSHIHTHILPYTGTRIHGDSPDVTFHGRTDLHFPYVPSHLSYMLLELLKNSMRATVETHGTDRMPPIRIVIADSEDNEDVSVDVC